MDAVGSDTENNQFKISGPANVSAFVFVDS